MAKKPWITAEDVRSYTDRKEVKEREESKLLVDIARAEAKIINITNNHFTDEEYPELPDPVRIAMIITAEAYAINKIESQNALKSETFDEYSYTAADRTVDLSALDLTELLKPYIVPKERNAVLLTMRSL